MGNTFKLRIRLSRNQTKLGMYLVTIQSVDHLTSRIFQLPGPFNIILLVKPGSEFYQNHNFLAVFCRLNQRLNHLTLLCQTVKRHLDGNDILILRSFSQKPQERPDGFIRIRKELVTLLDLLNHTPAILEHRGLLRRPLCVEQVLIFPKHILNLEHKRKVKRNRRVEYILLLQPQIIIQHHHTSNIQIS